MLTDMKEIDERPWRKSGSGSNPFASFRRGSSLSGKVFSVLQDTISYEKQSSMRSTICVTKSEVWSGKKRYILIYRTSADNVHYVFLSATIPNARQFAESICYLHHQPCHVVYTDYRPTPLQHFLYSAGSDGLYEVVDVQGRFREDQFAKAMSFLAEKGDQPRMSGPGGSSNIVKIIRTIKEQDMFFDK